MYPGVHAKTDPDKPAYVMAATGQVVTYGQLDEASNRLAHVFRDLGLRRGDHVALMLENHPRFFEIVWAAQRSGLYYTAISSRLTPNEAAYIVDDCGAQVFITSKKLADVAQLITADTPKVRLRLINDGSAAGYESYEDTVATQPATPIDDEAMGYDMLYSSGTTGRPKGVQVPLPEGDIATTPMPVNLLGQMLYGFRPDMRYISPAPLYHAAPLRFCVAVMQSGGTVVVMEHFDPEDALRLIEEHSITHSQWVPTMFVRMLKLDDDVRTRYDLSSLEVAIHAAAPCPVPVKKQMIDWWGPVIYEYYAGTEGNGFCAITSQEWLEHPGSVGKPLVGELHIVDDDGSELPPGQAGTIYFGNGGQFEYHNDPEKTEGSKDPKGRGWSTLGDIGYVDDDGYLYLTDRKAYMIISGGVNIYPQEAENVLTMHPKVLDVAVIGVPNEEMGEEVKAIVQPVSMADAGPHLERELLDYCRANLAHYKCPRTIEFEAELPRHPTGKLYKRLLRDRYWPATTN
jgi:acyl-CoA synthetase (AMP-forming)/AMP-acid ligase II